MALTLVLFFSFMFAATHILMSHGRIREGLIENMGEWVFRGVYSLISLVTLVTAVVIFWKYRFDPGAMGPMLWPQTHALLPLTYLFVLLGLILLFLSVATPSPTGMMPASMEPRGVLRITRHPMNMGFASFALGHMLMNPRLGEVALFGSLFAVGFFGAYHQDRRKTRERGEDFLPFKEKTSVLPFAAIAARKTKFSFTELSIPMLIIALAVFAGMIYFHGRLFGVTPY